MNKGFFVVVCTLLFVSFSYSPFVLAASTVAAPEVSSVAPHSFLQNIEEWSFHLFDFLHAAPPTPPPAILPAAVAPLPTPRPPALPQEGISGATTIALGPTFPASPTQLTVITQPAPTGASGAITPPLSSGIYVTKSDLSSFLTALKNVVLALSTTVSSPPPPTPSNSSGQADASVQQQLTALQQQISLTNRITNLSNVTITGGVRGLAASDIPDLSGTYLTAASVIPHLTSSFTVDTGATVTAGDIVAMASNGKIAKWLASANPGTQVLPTTAGNNTNAPLVVNLDATHFIYAYRDSVNGSKLTAIAGFISGTTVTFGTAVVFSNSTATLATGALATTSATSFVISYTDSSDTSKIKAIAGSISADTTITTGTPVTASNSVGTPVMVMLDATHFVLTYKDTTNSSQTYSVAGTVTTNTNTITIGTPVLAATNTNNLLTSGLLNGNGGVVALDSTHFLIAYLDSSGGTANQTTAIAASVSANAITFGSAVVASTSVNLLPKNTWGTAGPVTLIDSTHFLITFWDSKTSNRLSVIAGLVSGTTVSFGTGVQASTVTSTTGLNVVAMMMDSTHFQLIYYNTTAPTTLAGLLSGTNNLTITTGTAATGADAGGSGNTLDTRNVQFLDSTHFAFSNTFNNGAGSIKTQVFSLSGTNNLTTTAGTAVSTSEGNFCLQGSVSFITVVDATHYVLTYLPSGCNIKSVEVVVSGGTTVTLGTAVVGANTTGIGSSPSAVTNLGSGKYLITYSDNTNTSKQTALVGQDSSGTITFGSSGVGSGSTQTTLSSTAANVSATLDSTHFVTVFNDTNNSSKISAAIGTLSGGVVTFGTTYLLATSTTAITTVELATTTAGFVLAYKDSTNSSHTAVVAASVSGTTITAGTPTFNVTLNTNNPVMTRLDGTHFVLTYTDSTNSNALTSIAGTVSGTTLTFGTAVVASNSTTNIAFSGNLNAAAPLDSTHFVLTYVDTTSNSYAASVVGTISADTTITFGTPVNTAQVGTPQLAVMDSTHFTLAYIDTTDTTLAQGKLKVVPAVVSGTAVTYGSSVVASNSNSSLFLIAPLDSTHFVLAYVDATNDYKGTAKVGVLSGTNNLTATMGNAVVFGTVTANTNSFSTAGGGFFLSSTDSAHFVVAFSDSSTISNTTSAGVTQRLQVLTSSVSGSVITLGTPTTLSAVSTVGSSAYTLWSLPILDSTHAVLLYQDDPDPVSLTGGRN